MKTKNIFLILLIAAALWSGCKKDEDPVVTPPPPQNEEEVITTMTLIMVDSSNSANIRTATFRDPDGDGGAAYDIFDTIVLDPNKTWHTSLLLLNETASPVDTISEQVLEEANDHRFCFTPAGTSATVTITDLDGNSLPIGLQSKWKTLAPGMGSMLVELRHQPGTKDGTCVPGTTDIQVNFTVKVQ